MSKPNRWAALAAATVFVALAGLAFAPSALAQRPNIVVILTDDLNENVYQTAVSGGYMPNLKRHVIDRGVSFENSFVTNAICCPSRTTFLTGMYSHNHKIYGNIGPNPLLPGIMWDGWFPKDGNPGLNQNTIGVAMQNLGYRTGHIGKYLNGYGVFAPEGYGDPATYIEPGWNDWQMLIDPTTYLVYDYQLSENGTVVDYGDQPSDYQTDVLATKAVQFINREAQNPGSPFFLVVTPLAPHVEFSEDIAGTDDYRDRFQTFIRPAPRHEHLVDGNLGNGELPELDTTKPSFNEADVSDKPNCPRPPPEGIVYEPFCVQELQLLSADFDVPNVKNQYKVMLGSMLALDDMVGVIVQSLVANGVLGNTILVFTSDNGWLHGEHRMNDKRVAYEESIGVPLVIRGPGFAQGQTSPHIVLNNDLAPTFAAMGAGGLHWQADGRNLLPLLIDPDRPDWNRRSFLVESFFVPSALKYELGTMTALRRVTPGLDYTYMQWFNDPSQPGVITDREFYNNQTDPYQLDSIDLQPGTTAGFDNLISTFKTCAGQFCTMLESF